MSPWASFTKVKAQNNPCWTSVVDGKRRFRRSGSRFPDVTEVHNAAVHFLPVDLFQGRIEALYGLAGFGLFREVDQRLVEQNTVAVEVSGRPQPTSPRRVRKCRFRHGRKALSAARNAQ